MFTSKRAGRTLQRAFRQGRSEKNRLGAILLNLEAGPVAFGVILRVGEVGVLGAGEYLSFLLQRMFQPT